MNEAELIRAVAEGDETAFKELINLYQGPIHNFAFRFLGDADEAKDVAQETFLRIFRSIRNSRSLNGLKPYAFKITRNLCIDKKRKKQPDFSANPPDMVENKTPFEMLAQKQSINMLFKEVQSLPESQQSVILLRHTEEFSYAEIANVMEISVSAVESLLVRARKTLRKKIKTIGL